MLAKYDERSIGNTIIKLYDTLFKLVKKKPILTGFILTGMISIVGYFMYKATDIHHEDKVWDSEDKVSDLPELIGQQSLIQKTLLYQLAVKNILDSYLPDLSTKHRESFFEIINTINVNPDICLQNIRNYLPDPIDRKKVDYLINKASSYMRGLQNRFLANASIEWFMPEFVTFLNISSVRLKKDHEIQFPFIVSNHFQTDPPLITDKKYLLAIIDCEKIKSKMIETYIKNVALTLESAVKNQNGAVGASLVIKGRVSKNVLKWFRGSSPIDASPIPNVEIIYTIPIDTVITSEDYLFTLKQGTKYRLRKNNKYIKDPIAQKIYQTWQILRPYVVVDQLITEAVSNTDNFASFIHFFWKKFNELKSPNPDIPNFKEILIQMETNNEFSNFAENKIKLYRQSLEEETKCKILARSNKAKKLLEKFYDGLVNDVCDRVRTIASKPSEEEGLFYLDWNHIIYDALKGKGYNLEFEEIISITPDILEEKNSNFAFYVNRCILKVDDLSKPFDKKIRVHFNEKHVQQGNTNDYSNRLFNWTLLTVITAYMQLDLQKTKEPIKNFVNCIFNYINQSKYSLFYAFINFFDIARSQNTDKNDHEMISEFSNIFGFTKNIHNPFDQRIMEYFMGALHEKLSELKKAKDDSKNKSQSVIDEFQLVNLFDDTTSSLDASSQTSTVSDKKILTQEMYSSEIEITSLLERTPLFDNISLNDIKALLTKYEKEFDAVNLSPSDREDYPKLERLNNLIKFWNDNKVWRYFYFFNIYKKNYNIVKYIYVITKDGKIKVAYEPITGDRSDRPCHSQLANGLGVKAAGELIFQYDNGWKLIIINNGSGHYRPPAHLSLIRAKEQILHNLDRRISVKSIVLLNSLKPGMTLASGWDDIDDIIVSLSRESVHTVLKNISISAKILKKRKGQLHIDEIKEKLILRDCGAGGDCLFKSIASHISNLTYDELRQLTCAALLSNRANYEQFIQANETDELQYVDESGDIKREVVTSFDRYLMLLGRKGTWGGQIELSIIAQLLERPICLISDGDYLPMIFPSQILPDGSNRFDGDPIIIHYNGIDHYQAFVPANADVNISHVMQKLIISIIEPGLPIAMTFFGSLAKQYVHDYRHTDVRIGQEYDKRYGLISL